MSYISDKVNEISAALDKVVDSASNCNVTDEELKGMFKLLDKMSRTKTTLETISLSYQRGQQVARCLDIKNYDIRKIRNKKVTTQYTKNTMPAELYNYDPEKDSLWSVETICSELKIAFPTFDSWRRNWRSDRSIISFPPPVIYVYDSPRWTLRQLEWWLAAYKGKVYIKGLRNDSTGNN